MTTGPVARAVSGLLETAGGMTALALEGFRNTWRVRQWGGEFVDQCWFLIRVCTLPVLLIAIPLGSTIALQVGDLARQLGAQAATGSVVVVAIVREVAPIATAVLIAGAGGSAISADMGSRRIRSELDAMDVMGVDPVHRLVTPRLWAASTIGTLLVSLVVLAGVAGGYVFNVLLQDVTAGGYLSGATLLVRVPDVLQALFKAWVFGFIAAIVACHRGMTCEVSPVGVGRAVNRAVVTTFVLVFAANYVITTLYFQLFPPRL